MITKIAEKNGIEKVKELTKEELAELLAAIFRYQHRKDNIENLAEEMADVMIMIEQYFYLEEWLFQDVQVKFKDLKYMEKNIMFILTEQGDSFERYLFLLTIYKQIDNTKKELNITDKVNEYKEAKLKRTGERLGVE